ncbi:MAG: hypothetical protein IJL26_02445 [Clostridia bacterium]|nr:hypothetical protein [Clostridia bacterium]
MEVKLPAVEPNDTIPTVISAFANVIDFIRKLYFLIYNVIANIAGNPTKPV